MTASSASLAAQPDKLAAPYGTECVHGFSVLRIFGNDRYAHVGIYRSQLGGNGRKQSLVACVSVAVCAAVTAPLRGRE